MGIGEWAAFGFKPYGLCARRYLLETCRKAGVVCIPLSKVITSFSDLWLKHIIIPSQKGQTWETCLNHTKKPHKWVYHRITGLGIPGEDRKVGLFLFSSPRSAPDCWKALTKHFWSERGKKQKQKQKNWFWTKGQTKRARIRNHQEMSKTWCTGFEDGGMKIILHYFFVGSRHWGEHNSCSDLRVLGLKEFCFLSITDSPCWTEKKTEPRAGRDLTKVTYEAWSPL